MQPDRGKTFAHQAPSFVPRWWCGHLHVSSCLMTARLFSGHPASAAVDCNRLLCVFQTSSRSNSRSRVPDRQPSPNCETDRACRQKGEVCHEVDHKFQRFGVATFKILVLHVLLLFQSGLVVPTCSNIF